MAKVSANELQVTRYLYSPFPKG